MKKNKILALVKNDYFLASFFLVAVINLCFFSVLWEGKTLLLSATGNLHSVMPAGFYGKSVPFPGSWRTPDPYAPNWAFEPWLKLEGEQYTQEKNFPLWNPYAAYGTPLAAAMQPQPFFPPALFACLRLNPFTYSLFILCRLLLAGLFTYLFVRLFFDPIPCVFAALFYMFSTYFMFFLNLPHVSVEVSLPLLLFGAELLFRKTNFTLIALNAVFIFLNISGGMPEASFLSLSFAVFYFLFRFMTDKEKRRKWQVSVGAIFLANALGLLLAAPQWLLFLEFLPWSSNSHQVAEAEVLKVGSMSFRFDLGFIRSFVPTIVVVPFVFLSLLSYRWKNKQGQAAKGAYRVFLFFSIALILMLLKQYGFFLVNWIGGLPLLKIVFFAKYLEPLIIFCLSFLAAAGLAAWLRQEVEVKTLFFSGSLALVMAVTSLANLAKGSQSVLLSSAGGIFSVLAVAALWYWAVKQPKIKIFAGAAFILILLGGVYLNSIYPFFMASRLPGNQDDPYTGTPYVRFLKEHNIELERVFSRDGVLVPNWPSVFGLFGVRSFDALYYRRYRNFVRAFTPTQDLKQLDLYWWTYLAGPYAFRTPLEKKYLELSSIRYLLSLHDYGRNFRGVSGKFQELRPDPYFKKVYNGEIKIYEVGKSLPRAAVFYGAEAAGTDEQALYRLKDPLFPIRDKLVVAMGSMQPGEKNEINKVIENRMGGMTAARITEFHSQRVVIEAQAKNEGVLMLTDTTYPGWNVYVDDFPKKILQVDYLFRGVYLPAGRHHVEFKYEPVPFLVGQCLAWGSLLFMLFYSFSFFIRGLTVKNVRKNA